MNARQQVTKVLREATKPLTSREVAARIPDLATRTVLTALQRHFEHGPARKCSVNGRMSCTWITEG